MVNPLREKSRVTKPQSTLVRDYVITFHDGHRLRSLHPSVLSQADREAIEAGIRRQVERLAKLERGHPEPPQGTTEALGASSLNPMTPFRAPIPPEEAHVLKAEAPLMTQGEMARTAGYTGDVCTVCHGFRLKRTGSCVTCEDCGSNAGCG
jgi:hypothetical protein